MGAYVSLWWHVQYMKNETMKSHMSNLYWNRLIFSKTVGEWAHYKPPPEWVWMTWMFGEWIWQRNTGVRGATLSVPLLFHLINQISKFWLIVQNPLSFVHFCPFLSILLSNWIGLFFRKKISTVNLLFALNCFAYKLAKISKPQCFGFTDHCQWIFVLLVNSNYSSVIINSQ